MAMRFVNTDSSQRIPQHEQSNVQVKMEVQWSSHSSSQQNCQDMSFQSQSTPRFNHCGQQQPLQDTQSIENKDKRATFPKVKTFGRQSECSQDTINKSFSNMRLEPELSMNMEVESEPEVRSRKHSSLQFENRRMCVAYCNSFQLMPIDRAISQMVIDKNQSRQQMQAQEYKIQDMSQKQPQLYVLPQPIQISVSEEQALQSLQPRKQLSSENEQVLVSPIESETTIVDAMQKQAIQIPWKIAIYQRKQKRTIGPPLRYWLGQQKTIFNSSIIVRSLKKLQDMFVDPHSQAILDYMTYQQAYLKTKGEFTIAGGQSVVIRNIASKMQLSPSGSGKTLIATEKGCVLVMVSKNQGSKESRFTCNQYKQFELFNSLTKQQRIIVTLRKLM